MKKTIISALALMLGVLGFSGCVKNADETIINSEIQEFTLISYADAPNTRMNISGDKTTGFSTNWEKDDQIGIYAVNADAAHRLYTCNYPHAAEISSDGKATFTGTVRSTGGKDFNLYAYYPYTAGSTYEDPDDQNGVDCKISSEQTMSGASFDKSCAYMVAKTGLTVNTSSQNDTYKVGNWQFRHTVAFINLSTKEISAKGVSGNEIVSSVKFDAAGKTLAGDFQFNLEDGTMTFTKSESAVTVNVPANTKLSDLSAWIVTNPFEMTAADKLVITITTDAHTIIKNVSIPKNFEAANVYTLNLTIDNKCEIPKDAVYELVTNASTLAVGDKVIIAAKPNTLFTGDYAMGTNQKDTNRAAAEVVIDNNTITTNSSSNVQIFELQTGTINNTFALYAENGNNIGYISAGNKEANSLTTVTSITDNSSWSINIDKSSVATIVANGSGSRHTLQFNNAMHGADKNYLFNCYSSANQKPVQIYRLQDDNLAKPVLASVTGTTEKITATWAAVQHAKSYIYKLNKLNDNVETTVIDETPYEPTDLKAETVTLTIEGPFNAGEQYVLYVKSTADAPFVESAPAKSEPFDIKEAGTEPDNVVILLNLSNADTYPTDFPKSSSSNVKTYEGIFGGYNFKFSCNNAVYFSSSSSSSSSYLMIGKSGTTDQTASKIQFPAISGLKLTKVVIKSSSGTSTNVKSSIANLSGTTLSGGESWTFEQDTEHTYTLLDTAPNTSYQLYILSTKSKGTYNAQLVKLELTYEK